MPTDLILLGTSPPGGVLSPDPDPNTPPGPAPNRISPFSGVATGVRGFWFAVTDPPGVPVVINLAFWIFESTSKLWLATASVNVTFPSRILIRASDFQGASPAGAGPQVPPSLTTTNCFMQVVSNPGSIAGIVWGYF